MVASDRAVLSMPELRALAARAARGTGHPWGVAEEFGYAIAWLAHRNTDWPEAALDMLTAQTNRDITPKRSQWHSALPMCPLKCGIALTDFCQLEEGPRNGLELGPIYQPLILLPFLARAAKLLQTCFDVECDQQAYAMVSPNSATLHTSVSAADHMVLKPTSETAPEVDLTMVSDISIRHKEALEALALKMTVPSSEASEARAGSSKPDND